MKFKFDDDTIMLSHLMLSHEPLVDKIAATQEWKDAADDDMNIEAKLTLNGIECPAEAFEKLLQQMWEQAKIKTGRADFERAVAVEAESILRQQKNKIFKLMDELEEKLECADDMIKFPWEEVNDSDYK